MCNCVGTIRNDLLCGAPHVLKLPEGFGIMFIKHHSICKCAQSLTKSLLLRVVHVYADGLLETHSVYTTWGDTASGLQIR